MASGFNIERDKVVGVLERNSHNNHVKLIVCGFISEDGRYESGYDFHKIFPPNGKLFVPSFNYDTHAQFKDKEFVSCYSEKITEQDEWRDQFSMKGFNISPKDYIKHAELKHFGFQCFDLRKEPNEKYVDILSLNEIIDSSFKGTFYAITNKQILGPFTASNGKVSFPPQHVVHSWNRQNLSSRIIITGDLYCLSTEPDFEDANLLDCMNEKQIFEWFREQLKIKSPDFVKMLDNKTTWRKDLPQQFSDHKEKKTTVEIVRFQRLENVIDNINLYYEDFEYMIDKSDKLEQVVKNNLQQYKKELFQKYDIDLKEDKDAFELERELLDKKLSELDKEEIKKKDKIKKLNQEVSDLTLTLDIINNNKKRIVQDFSLNIIKDVLSLCNHSSPTFTNNNDSFVIERVERKAMFTKFNSNDQFLESFKYCLVKYSLKSRLAKRGLTALYSFNAVFIKDIRIALSFIEATNNANYIIQGTAPNWMSFKDLWDNGLGEIWSSAIQSPDTLHFLILQDINMSATECYLRPFLDIISGFRKKIPYANTLYPSNLRILCSIAPVESPEVGLPMQAKLFNNWGAIGFDGEIECKSKETFKPKDGYLSSFLDFQFDQDEMEDERVSQIEKIKVILQDI